MFQRKTQVLKEVMGLMAHCSTFMGQLRQLVPGQVFHPLVDSHAWRGPNPRKFAYWPHLGARLSGPGSGRKSLRDLMFSVNRQVCKCYHLGLAVVKRSTLADAGLAQVQEQGGLGTSGTHPPGANYAPGALGTVGDAWSSTTR
jgi:hypothetical protein